MTLVALVATLALYHRTSVVTEALHLLATDGALVSSFGQLLQALGTADLLYALKSGPIGTQCRGSTQVASPTLVGMTGVRPYVTLTAEDRDAWS